MSEHNQEDGAQGRTARQQQDRWNATTREHSLRRHFTRRRLSGLEDVVRETPRQSHKEASASRLGQTA